jgi:hypothetical protein
LKALKKEFSGVVQKYIPLCHEIFKEAYMKKFFTAQQLHGRFDCFSQFNRIDPICLKYCALNIRCALAKKQWFEMELAEDYFPAFSPPDLDFGLE